MSKNKLSDSFTYLQNCICKGKEKEFLEISSSLSDINEQDKMGQTLIWKAVSYNRAEILQYLLNAGADPNIPDKEGFPPFHLAILNGNIHLVQVLFKKKVNIDVLDSYGNNGIFRALFSNKRSVFHIIVFLLKNGVDPDQPNHSGKTPREIANLIANYDYKSLIGISRPYDSARERIAANTTAFDDTVITDTFVLNGARVNYIEHFGIDRVFGLFSKPLIDPKDVRISTKSSILKRYPEIMGTVTKLGSNQIANHVSLDKWSIKTLFE